jgi:3-oxoacyl-[acyl-carrier protein] reductase
MIILTGASGGLGKSILADLAKIDKVLAIYNKNLPHFSHKNILPYKIDLTNESQIKKLVNDVCESKITIVHLAGFYSEALAINMTSDNFQKHFDINIKSVFLLNKYFLSKMLQNSWGRIIHFSSPAAEFGHPGTVGYAASKSALDGLSKVISNEYAKFNITSNIIVAGYFEAGMYLNLKEETKSKLKESIPSKTLGDPKNITNAIKFIINSEFVNGATLNIDGGVSGI